MSVDDTDRIIAEAMMYLFETAAKDGILSEEEKKFISEMEITLNYYKEALKKAYDDGIITPQEVKYLTNLKEAIISEGFDVAEEFNGVSKDEMNMIISMICSLKVPKKTE
ncbi:MAG: hypothetical protein ACXAB7_16010 [Candidatus Kariarchaeaceae archaeon]|jgi:hypothetical protein